MVLIFKKSPGEGAGLRSKGLCSENGPKNLLPSQNPICPPEELLADRRGRSDEREGGGGVLLAFCRFKHQAGGPACIHTPLWGGGGLRSPKPEKNAVKLREIRVKLR